jgi:AmmeMemoRadiSam system protein B/AmmeMemoRadiSam system protein A
MNTPIQHTLLPSAAGRFYPANPNELRADIQCYLDDAGCEPSNEPLFAFLVPHAGYVFSAPVAAYSFKHASTQNPDTVLFVALSHKGVQGGCVFHGTGMKTPLGEIENDLELSSALLELGEPFYTDVPPYSGEHSIEVNLPFVQEVFPSAKVAAVLTSHMDQDTCRKLGNGITHVIKRFPQKKILVCVSSDMSHYPAYDAANRIDQSALHILEAVDPQTYYTTIKQLEQEPVENLRCVMCGCAAMLTTIEAAQELGVKYGKVLHYRNSGDSEYGDHDKVVGYGSMAWYYPTVNEGFCDTGKLELLQIARQSIAAKLAKQEYQPFVTIYHKRNLRGCLGRFDSSGLPLYKLIAKLAAETATNDNRFTSLSIDELPDTSISISVLSPQKKVNGPDDIEVGKHGIKISNGYHNGTLLPQVASERNWTVKEFLENTCIKANLHRNAWQEPETEIYVYEADVFCDEDFSDPNDTKTEMNETNRE